MPPVDRAQEPTGSLDADLRRLALGDPFFGALHRCRRFEQHHMPVDRPVEEPAQRCQMLVPFGGRSA
jgi:hypothetical protein